MKDYSYTELKEMQDRAMERVRAMQQRASETVSRENSLQEEKPKPDAHIEQNSYTKPHHIKMPVNMPPRESAEESRGSKASTDSNPASSSVSAIDNGIIERPRQGHAASAFAPFKIRGSKRGAAYVAALHNVIKAVKKGCKSSRFYSHLN